MLARRDFAGRETRELLGPRDVSLNEAAAIIGSAIGKPNLSYSNLPAMTVKMAMTEMGLSDNVAGLLLEMMEAMNSGWMAPLEKRSPANTTPTSIETFAREEFAPRFQAGTR
jgi:uncharacterized protein YbjT (DUF2867 family)